MSRFPKFERLAEAAKGDDQVVAALLTLLLVGWVNVLLKIISKGQF